MSPVKTSPMIATSTDNILDRRSRGRRSPYPTVVAVTKAKYTASNPSHFSNRPITNPSTRITISRKKRSGLTCSNAIPNILRKVNVMAILWRIPCVQPHSLRARLLADTKAINHPRQGTAALRARYPSNVPDALETSKKNFAAAMTSAPSFAKALYRARDFLSYRRSRRQRTVQLSYGWGK